MKVAVTVKIMNIEERFEQFNWRKTPDGRTEFDQRSLGWFIHFEGSAESIKLFDSKPEWRVGQSVRITFEAL